MLIEGLAWHYKDYSTSKEYSQLEDTARLVLIWIQYLFILIFWLLIINATTYLGNRKKEYFGKRIQLHHGNGVRKRGLKMRKHQMKTKIANQKKTKVNPPLGVF